MIRSKSETIAGIQTVVVTTKSGRRQVEYRAHIGMMDGKRVRLSAYKKSSLLKKIDRWYDDRALGGDSFAQLTRKDAMDAVLALAIIRGHHASVSLTSVVEGYFRSSDATVVEKPLTEAYAEFLANFTTPGQIHSVKTRVGKFVAKHPDKMVCNVSTADVTNYLKSIEPCAPKTWNNSMQYIRTFFNWCAKKVRRYCAENPIADLEKKPIASKMPEFARPNTVAALFAKAEANQRHHDSFLYWLTLSYFCGMRKAEIGRLDPADVRIADGSVIVRQPKGYTKGISHRTFHIPAVAEAWLKSVDLAQVAADPISYRVFQLIANDLKKGIEGTIPDNAGRHTFITMHIAAYGEPQKTLGIVGTSESMRRHNYEGVGVTKAEAEAYFAIRPAVVAA